MNILSLTKIIHSGFTYMKLWLYICLATKTIQVLESVYIYQHGRGASLAQFLKGVVHVDGASDPIPCWLLHSIEKKTTKRKKQRKIMHYTSWFGVIVHSVPSQPLFHGLCWSSPASTAQADQEIPDEVYVYKYRCNKTHRHMYIIYSVVLLTHS